MAHASAQNKQGRCASPALVLHALVRRNEKKSQKQSSSTVLVTIVVTRSVTRRGGSASACLLRDLPSSRQCDRQRSSAWSVPSRKARGRASLSLSPAGRHGVGAAACAPLLHFQNERAGRPPRAAAWAWWMVYCSAVTARILGATLRRRRSREVGAPKG